jgi:hypothetical protein
MQLILPFEDWLADGMERAFKWWGVDRAKKPSFSWSTCRFLDEIPGEWFVYNGIVPTDKIVLFTDEHAMFIALRDPDLWLTRTATSPGYSCGYRSIFTAAATLKAVSSTNSTGRFLECASHAAKAATSSCNLTT